MLRVFHPIGQGAFYSERHDNFNIVYDCGEWKKSKNAQYVVENSFEDGEHINCLFISHFDFDHVCFIENLHKKYHVDTCVLPLIHEGEKLILKSSYHDCNSSNLDDLLFNPHNFFGNKTKIIFVKMAEESTIDEIKATEDKVIEKTFHINNLSDNQIIDSGTRIGIKDWVYVPYNNKCQSRIKELEQQFNKRGLDLDRYKIEVDYCINNLEEIKDAYKDLKGTINTNSMYLYSGPLEEDINDYKVFFYCHGGKNPCICTMNAGCIYTGDGSLTKIKKIYKDYWSSVGTIQVPHHGSASSFNFSLLNKSKNPREYFLFPASFGNDNIYGHPAQNVVCNIFKNNSCFIPVTDKTDSFFIEKIYKIKN